MKILLTGSEGNISKSLLRPLLSDHEVVGFDLVLGDDMLDPESLKRKADGCDVIVHTAGISGPQCSDVSLYENVSVRGGKNVIDVGLPVVFFSSMAYYGVDAWMRNRDECGPVIGDGVAVPKCLPIDTAHPSVATYGRLDNPGGAAYGMSKAKIEEYAKGKDFVSLRLCGFREVTAKRKRRWVKIRKKAKAGLAPYRKMWLYSLAGTCTKECLSEAVLWALEQRGTVTRNVGVMGTGLKDVCRAYFPTLEPADQIFI